MDRYVTANRVGEGVGARSLPGYGHWGREREGEGITQTISSHL